ncbi:MAG: tRNA (adenosine(37)-N6)-threonylcarbamoyltransferase complex ATPase subunit type 1 TsaE [Candidatus Nomurabacteria bacterium]|jgi:tRNA threonylcarbamoyladenosine biosynthesis protein TsaE|nr:tRNA (adenosine(37)-N6)-threonylcarbamoyltransferase complex ATPase subunit type 1 TsaE [Candidatus Nomurabacteria bacterium]
MKLKNADELNELGRELGTALSGGEVIELVGDVGAGKTTFTQGLARGLGIDEPVSSPSFTISRSYSARDGLHLNHYDFYRLSDAGIMRDEIAESLTDPQNITVVEWGASVADVLPNDRRVIEIKYLPDGEGREVIL